MATTSQTYILEAHLPEEVKDFVVYALHPIKGQTITFVRTGHMTFSATVDGLSSMCVAASTYISLYTALGYTHFDASIKRRLGGDCLSIIPFSCCAEFFKFE